MRQHRVIHVYEPVLNGHRVTMGWTGYFLENKPLLYDRGTESFWLEEADGDLKAIAGTYKGAELPEIAESEAVRWSDWRGRYPQSRLLVGADRSKGRPSL
jgi:hypothetical protein